MEKGNSYNDTTGHRRDSCWPDAVVPSDIVLDDVSQMSATSVQRLLFVRTQADAFEALEDAAARGLSVSARGTKHAMGGHSIAQGGICIDMEYVNHVNYDQDSERVRCGAGARWSSVIQYLNEFGRAPRTLQSYCSFSVGGSIAVNAHGITSDFVLAECIRSLTVLRLHNETGERQVLRVEPGDELFRQVVGGYGLFGIIWECEMVTVQNRKVWMEIMHLTPSEFPHVYAGVLNRKDVCMKLARIDITNFEHIALYVFRADARRNASTVSDLPTKPREMSAASSLMYKWLSGPLMPLRFKAERAFGVALDWAPVSTCNELLFESAIPLARLYSPLFAFDDTFILQEYFIPQASFASFFIDFKEAIANVRKETLLTLLNTTIRFVRADTLTLLPYARQDSYAFVLYYRLRRTKDAENRLAFHHGCLAALALKYRGAFYLPYRHHYSNEELEKSYPTWSEFVTAKEISDPHRLFSNQWWRRYHVEESSSIIPFSNGLPTPPPLLSAPEKLDAVSKHRSSSFRDMMNDGSLRLQFKEDFLVATFSVLSPAVVMNALQQACYDERNMDDNDIYEALLSRLSEDRKNPVAEFLYLLNSIRLLATQRAEFTREVVSIVSRLGRLGELHDFLNIGDAGKMCKSLRKALSMHGATVVAHDCDPGPEDVAGVLERGSLDAVGQFERIDYEHPISFSGLKDASFDLVSMMQGLHHLPPLALGAFLDSVLRVLRPGGLFLIREHDMRSEDLRPILDCAHMVFNAATGVGCRSERGEIRAFRSVEEWRSILRSRGFEDSGLVEMQPHDCTVDVMMCFRKPGDFPQGRALELSQLPEEQASSASRIAGALPKVAMDMGMGLVNSLLSTLPKASSFLVKCIHALLENVAIPGVNKALASTIERTMDGWLAMLEEFQPLADSSTSVQDGPSLIPEEIFLLIPIMRVRAKNGGLVESVVVDIFDQVSDALASMGQTSSAPASTASKLPAALSQDELMRQVHLLVHDIPELEDVQDVVRNAGLGSKAADLIVAALTDDNLLKLRDWMVESLDADAWHSLVASLERVRKEARPPTLDLILEESSAWNTAARAVLGSEAVTLSWTQTIGLQSVGLGSLVALYKSSQETRRLALLKDPSQLDDATRALVQSKLESMCPLEERTMKLGAKPLENIANVLCVESANMTAHSLTRLLSDTVTDVTAHVAEALNGNTGLLELSTKLSLPSTWRAGSHSLSISYRRLPVGVVRNDQVDALVQEMHGASLMDRDWRAKNTSFTFLKLPEWLQAELVQHFGNSMDHTPFYRFPFVKSIEMLISVLSAETRLCAAKDGWFRTLLSDAFTTDLVGVVIFTLGFGALSVAAAPIKMALGDSYPEGTQIEKVLVTAPRSIKWPEKHVQHAQQLTAGIWLLTLGTFKLFTPALCALADVPSVSVLRISNNSVVQVRLSLKQPVPDNVVASLVEFPGCSLATDFTFPKVGNVENERQVCLSVQVINLMALIRFCRKEAISVHQVYDFYNYE